MALPGLLLVPLTVLTFQAQAGVRGRTDTVTKNAAADLLAIPTLSLSVAERDWTISLGSTSTASYLDVFHAQSNPLSFTEALIASFNYRRRTMTITVSESGQIGYQNLRLSSLTLGGSPLAPAPSASGPLPGGGGSNTSNGFLLDDMVLYGSSSTNVLISEMVSRNVTLNQFARVTVTSGFGESVQSYPSQLSFGGGIQAQYQLSQKETFGLQLWTDRISTREQAPLISTGLGATWNHSFSARVRGFINLGGSYIFPESKPAGVEVRPATLYPNMALGLNVEGSPFTVSIGVIPVIDQISGTVDTRFTGSVQYSERKGRVTWTAGLGSATSIEQEQVGRFVSFFGNASVGYAVARDLQLTAGGGSSYQLAPYANDNGSAIFFGQLSLNFTPRGLRL